MSLLLDTDVLLDVALDREPFVDKSAALLDALEARPGVAFVAWHTLSNFYYLVRPAKTEDETRELLLDLARFVQVAPTTTRSLLYACQLEMKDFEDALQVAAAMAAEARLIVTRNLRHYKKSPIPAVAPGDALAELG